MKLLTIFLFLLIFTTSCGSSHTVGGTAVVDMRSGEYVIRVENPVIEYCNALHPQVLHPDEVQRQTLIVQCLQLCSTQNNTCNIVIPEFPTQPQP